MYCSTTSNLGVIPMVRAPNYSASKAALHSFILVLREQLKGSKVKIIEIYPPAVQSNIGFLDLLSEHFLTFVAELHDEKHQPDIKNGRNIGMPLGDFTEEVRVSSEDVLILDC